MPNEERDFEVDFEGGPAGILKVDTLPFGANELSWDPYRSLYHFRMIEAFRQGVPVKLGIKMQGETISVKLLDHNSTFIKVEKLECLIK